MIKIDIFGMELAGKLPNWLSRKGRGDTNIDAIRAKHRQRHEDNRAEQKQTKQRAAFSLLGRKQ